MKKTAQRAQLRISVILPTFNRCHLIGETLESLFAQNVAVDEILVINDGSTDQTVQVLEKFGDRLTVHHQSNGGKAAALNRGLEMTSGELVWILDDDDILLPAASRLLSDPFANDPLLGFCAGRHLDFEVNAQTGAKERRAPGYMRASTPERIFPDLLAGCHIFQPGLMVRRSVYQSVGPFREDLMRSQDYEMILRIARANKGLHLGDTVFLHREHSGERGAKGQQFAASQNAERWAKYNATIFQGILDEVSDRELFSPEEWENTPSTQRPRLGLLARACVQGRQRMWSQAFDAFHAAAVAKGEELSEHEQQLIVETTLGSLGTPELVKDPNIRQRLKQLGAEGKTGAQIRKLLKRSMAWQLKQAVRDRSMTDLIGLMRFFAST